MKQPEDRATIDMLPKAKRGRPKKVVTLSGKERAQRFRIRRALLNPHLIAPYQTTGYNFSQWQAKAGNTFSNDELEKLDQRIRLGF